MRMPFTVLTEDYMGTKHVTWDWHDSTPWTLGEQVWGYWTAPGTTSCTAREDIWGYWTTPGTATYLRTTVSEATETAWTTWTWPSSVAVRSRNNHHVLLETVPVAREEVPETDEERAARLDRAARRDEERWRIAAERAELRKVADAKTAAAHERAKELLMSQLSPSQRKQYSRDRAFTVVGVSGRRYLIREGWAGNVDELDANGKAINRLCIHPTIGVPTPDNMLVQKLMLDTDEEQFRRTANHMRVVA